MSAVASYLPAPLVARAARFAARIHPAPARLTIYGHGGGHVIYVASDDAQYLAELERQLERVAPPAVKVA